LHQSDVPILRRGGDHSATAHANPISLTRTISSYFGLDNVVGDLNEDKQRRLFFWLLFSVIFTYLYIFYQPEANGSKSLQTTKSLTEAPKFTKNVGTLFYSDGSPR
jgi:hypothetical protein